MDVVKLGLSAKGWQFLSNPDRYVKASAKSDRPLVLQSTRRQFLTARDILCRLNGSCGLEPQRGVLLADDVGLGKTTVAALVAWVIASAGDKGVVRILAPNDVMKRRWLEELHAHVALLQECAPKLEVDARRIKDGKVGRLSAGSIQVVKHRYASDDLNLTCDLLIVDEAHRAKGAETAFSRALKRQKKHASRVLILTATPFSIDITELERMLSLVGGEAACPAIRRYCSALDDLYGGSTARDPDTVGERLARYAKAAVDAIRPFVIRHGVDELPNEAAAFGTRREWGVAVEQASPSELELMLRADRALRLLKEAGLETSGATNDPRFHVGWRHLHEKLDQAQTKVNDLGDPERAVVRDHLGQARRLRREVGAHAKMLATAQAVVERVLEGEKVLLFCHHHATAQELTALLHEQVPPLPSYRGPDAAVWAAVWREMMESNLRHANAERLCDAFVDYLCCDLIRSQVTSWLPRQVKTTEALRSALRAERARRQPRAPTIVEAARHLFDAMLDSTSVRAVLRQGGALPGANGGSRVLSTCDPSGVAGEGHLFVQNQEPDTAIAVFNSPFGPDVMVVTDKLSEGIDLHRYCRHLIHYELDPSPIRAIQRNGRLRRVGSWASVTEQPILYAYPAFHGTRDHRLVQIVKKRIDSFSLLLGGVQDFDVEQVAERDEEWRRQVVLHAKRQLADAGARLRAVEPGAQ